MLIAPTFDPARSAFVAWKAETQDYTPSADGDTPAALAAIPSSPTVVGYTDAPERNRRLNNGIGYGTASPFGLYNIRGRIEPDVRVVIRLGSFNFLMQCLINEVTLRMPKIALFAGVQGRFTEVYRNCQCGELQLNFAPGQGGEGGELTATASFWAQAVQEGSAMTISESAIRALGKPLFWHDVRNFNITGNDGTTDDYRRALMSTSATVNHNLERKGELQNWGDHEELSRAVDDIINHSETVTGQAQFHSRLSRALFTNAEQSQDWGDVVIRCSDGPALPVGGVARPYIVTMQDSIPTVETSGAAGRNTQLSYTVPYAAQKLSIALSE